MCPCLARALLLFMVLIGAGETAEPFRSAAIIHHGGFGEDGFKAKTTNVVARQGWVPGLRLR